MYNIFIYKPYKYIFLLLDSKKYYKNLHNAIFMLSSIIYYRGVLLQIMNFKNTVEQFSWILESAKIIDNFPDMILYVDSDGIIINSNQKAKDCFKLLSNVTISEIIKEGMNPVRQSIKRKKSILVEARNKEEGIFYAELTASRFGNNYCVALRNSTQLIEDLKEKNDIEKFNNEKNIMIHKIEDEIKSPINSITGFAQGLLDGIAGELSEKQIKYLKIINTNAQDLQEFTNKFTDFSYCESSLYKPDYKKFDIISTIKEILKEFSTKINPQKVNICYTYDNFENRNIYFDEKAFKKSITNIIETSLNMTETGVISIHITTPDDENAIAFGLEEDKKYIQIIIKDTGSGISPEEMKYICNPYAQLDNGKKNLLRSFRLGISSILIKRSQGYININSDVIQGTYYNIIIPIEKAQDE